GAAAAHDRKRAVDVTAAQISRNPDAGFKTHRLREQYERCGVVARPPQPGDKFYSSGCPVSPASSRTSRSEICPVIGNLRSRSNFSIAARVPGPYAPAAF